MTCSEKTSTDTNDLKPSISKGIHEKEREKGEAEWIVAREAGVLAAVMTDDLEALRRYSVLPGGFGTDTVRRIAWTYLLHVDELEEGLTVEKEEEDVEKHSDEGQVRLDTKRSFVYYPQVGPAAKQQLQDDLEYLIVSVLRRHPSLGYFQGYHDILSVFYLTFITESGSRDTPAWRTLTRCCEAVSLFRVRDGMGKGLQPLMGLLRILNRLLRVADPELAAFSNQISPVPTLPFFALSWILCLFSHDINTFAPIQRIFDFLLARNPITAIYLAVAMLMSKKKRLFEIYEALDRDPSSLHPYFARLPPLVADTPLSPPVASAPLTPAEMDAIINASDSESVNPHEPLYLSTLFQATDSLMAEFPPDHRAIRLSEIMGPDSMVRTYDAEIAGELSLEAAEALVHSDAILEDAAESEDEEEVVVPRVVRKSSIGTAVAVSVVVLGIGLAVYSHPKAWAEVRRAQQQAGRALWEAGVLVRERLSTWDA